MIDLLKSLEQHKLEQEQDPEWQKNNLEWDLRTTDWIVKKVRESDVYAQNLYAAMCNNEFTKNEVWPILQGEIWSCSWRYAGDIIADILDEGNYLDWYCSGMGGPTGDMGASGYLSEGLVSDEIRDDLLKLGWIVRENDES